MKKLLIALLVIAVVPSFALLIPRSMHTEVADTYGQGHFNIELGADYTVMDDTGNKNLTLTLQPYYGVLAFWALSARVPLVYTIPADELIDGEFGVSNIGLWNKVNVLNEEQYPVGVSVIADVTLPTGDPDKGIGTDKTDISGMAVISKHFMARIVGIHANVGYTYPQLPREDTYPVGTEPLSSVD
ncbi:MAG: transporter, partial [bacterium]|nr:transporter [bacterium]